MTTATTFWRGILVIVAADLLCAVLLAAALGCLR
jgi:hypothetical protein